MSATPSSLTQRPRGRIDLVDCPSDNHERTAFRPTARRAAEILKVLPVPGTLSTLIVPPWASTSPFVMKSPSPRPRRFARAAEFGSSGRRAVATPPGRCRVRDPRRRAPPRDRSAAMRIADGRAFVGILRGVLQQIGHDLLEPERIREDARSGSPVTATTTVCVPSAPATCDTMEDASCGRLTVTRSR